MTARNNEQRHHTHDNMAKRGLNGPSSLISSDAVGRVEDDTVLTTAAPGDITECWGLNPSDNHGDDVTVANDVTNEDVCCTDVESKGLCCRRREPSLLPRNSDGARECPCCDEYVDTAAAAGYSFRQKDSVTKDTLSTARRRHHGRLYPQYLWSEGPTTTELAPRKKGWGACLRRTLFTVRMAVTLFGMVFAGLVTFWALFPVYTQCRRPDYADGHDSAAATLSGILQETGSSPLYINQLQVSSERAIARVRMTMSDSQVRSKRTFQGG